jgi:hypothetical protein
MKKDKTFQVVGTFEIAITIPAKNRKEAKEFAQEEFAEFVNVDLNELTDAEFAYKKQTKKPKVFEVVDTDEDQQEQGEQSNETK